MIHYKYKHGVKVSCDECWSQKQYCEECSAINALKENVATGFTCYMDTILRASSLKFIEKKIMIPLSTSKKKINELIKKGFSLYKNTNSNQVTKKVSKDHNCQYYLKNNFLQLEYLNRQ